MLSARRAPWISRARGPWATAASPMLPPSLPPPPNRPDPLPARPARAQVLPFCSDETLEQLEKNLGALPSVTKMLQGGMTPRDITDRILEGIGSAGEPLSVTPR